eukprot:6345226-Pyramimonas_sp.AAC.1
MHDAVRAAKRALAHEHARTPEEQHFWAMRAVRGWRTGNFDLVRSAICALPFLLQIFDVDREECTDYARLCEFARSCHYSVLEAQLNQAVATTTEGEEEEARRLQAISRARFKMQIWRNMRRRVHLSGVLADDGSPCAT